MHIYGFMCLYAYRNCLQNARFSLLYAIDAKYRFDINFPYSFRNIESLLTQRFYIFFVLFFGGGGRGVGGGVQPVKIISLILSRVNR